MQLLWKIMKVKYIVKYMSVMPSTYLYDISYSGGEVIDEIYHFYISIAHI